MSYAATKRGKSASKANRAAARAAAERAAREAEARRRRTRLLVAAGVVVALLVAALITATQVRAAQERARLTGPENMVSDGIALYGDENGQVIGLTTEANGPDVDPRPNGDVRGFGVADVTLYTDYTDADAATFWATSGDEIVERLEGGSYILELHAIGETPAARAAARALACVADAAPDAAIAAHGALLAAQDRLAGASGADLAPVLAAILADAEVTGDGLADCLAGDRFTAWVDGAIQRAADGAVDTELGPVAATGVWVLDEPYDGDPADAEAFAAVLDEAAAAVGAEEESAD